MEACSDEKCFSKALANSIGFGDMACYSNVTQDPQTTALCSGFKTQEGWAMIHGWWWLSFARNNSPLVIFWPGLIFADVIYPIFSCGEQFGCMWMYSGEGWEYQVRWIIRSYPCSWSTSHWIYPDFQVLAGPAFIITFTISGVLMGFLADRSTYICIHHHCHW